MTIILAIDSSCDETGIGIAELTGDGTVTLLADEVASSVDEHVRFGGVELRFVPAGTNPEDRTGSASDERKRAIAAATQVVTDAAPAPSTSRLLWLLLALVVGAAVFFVLRGRA